MPLILIQEAMMAREHKGMEFREALGATAERPIAAETEPRYYRANTVWWVVGLALAVLAVLFMFFYDMDIIDQTGPTIDIYPTL